MATRRINFSPRLHSAKEGSVAEDDGYLVGYLMNGREHQDRSGGICAANVAQGPISRRCSGLFRTHCTGLLCLGLHHR
jgi:hypothetical protein